MSRGRVVQAALNPLAVLLMLAEAAPLMGPPAMLVLTLQQQVHLLVVELGALLVSMEEQGMVELAQEVLVEQVQAGLVVGLQGINHLPSLTSPSFQAPTMALGLLK
eukprot:gene8058-8253_t